MFRKAWSRDMTRDSNQAFSVAGLRFRVSRFEDRPIAMVVSFLGKMSVRSEWVSSKRGMSVTVTVVLLH